MKIISLTPSGTEIIASLDLLDDLVGRSHECNFPKEVEGKTKVTSSNMRNDVSLCQIDSFVKESKKTGSNIYEINEKIIVEIQPDYIVTQGLCDVCAISEAQVYGSLAAQKESLRLKPKVLSLSGYLIEDIMNDIQRLGKVFDRVEKAEKLIEKARESIRDLKKKPKIAKSVLFLEWVNPFFAPGHWIPEQINLAGFEAVLGRPGAKSREISVSSIIEVDPDYIVVACCGLGFEENKKIAYQLYDNLAISRLKAFSNKNIFAFDADSYFSRPTLRLLEGARQMRVALSTQSSVYRCA